MDEKRGPLICLEGIDGSGKGTQAELLARALRGQGVAVATFSFPRHETPAGQVVAACLRGEYGDPVCWPPRLAAPLFALDRYEARTELIEALQSGVVVCDRYVHSNVAHQAAKVSDEELGATISWIETLEYETLALPKPDIVIWLDMSVARTVVLVGKKTIRDHLAGLERDQHECNLNYQRQVATVYAGLAVVRSDWIIVRCSPTSVPRTPAQIHEEIVEKLGRRFPELFRATTRKRSG